jgi:Spy/CpxP family protein refolding chaperone
MAATLIVLAGCVSCGQAQQVPAQDEAGQNMSGGQRRKRVMQELNLSPEQIEKLRSQRTQNQQKNQELRQGLRAKQKALKEELQKPTVDRQKIRALAADIKSMSATLLDLRIESAITLKETLTPQQIQKIKERIQERRAKRQGNNKQGLIPEGEE